MEDVTSNMSIAVIMNHLACPEVDYEYWKNLFFGTFDIFGTFDGHWHLIKTQQLQQSEKEKKTERHNFQVMGKSCRN